MRGSILGPWLPADVFLACWTRGRPAALDVLVISPLQQLTLQEAASSQGHALSVSVARKLAAHSLGCHSAGVSFVPLVVVETLGGWCEEAVQAIRAIG